MFDFGSTTPGSAPDWGDCVNGITTVILSKSVYLSLSFSGQFYAIGFEGNFDPPAADVEIQRVKV